MRSKAPLALMEQAVMVLVFALAAALCLRAFVWSDARSRQNEARDQAVLQAQSAAETLKAFRGDFDRAADLLGGDWDGSVWTLSYDEGWQAVPVGSSYLLQVRPEDSGLSSLGRARVEVSSHTGQTLFSLYVCWQEVDSHA